jgi:protocatechuate 3,4-dioxygenase beta subunit
MMTANLTAEAAPKALTVALAKVALAGSGSIATAGISATLGQLGGGLLVKSLLVASMILVLSGLALWRIQPRGEHISPDGSLPSSVSDSERSPEKTAVTSKDEGTSALPRERQVASLGIDSWGSISGTVTDAETKAPIDGAYVVFVGDFGPGREQEHVTTDGNGYYRLSELKPGSYKLKCVVPGVQERGELEARTVSVAERQDVVSVDFAAFRSGLHIKGRVVDTEGRPVAKAMVMAARIGANQITEMQVNNFSAADGSFALYFSPGPSEGYVLAAVTSPMFGVPGDMLASEVEGFFYPSADGLPEVILTLRTSATLSGTVLDTQGQPVAGVRILPRSDPRHEFMMSWESAQTAEDGSFTTPGLPAGSYLMDLAPTTTGKFIRALPPNDEIEVAWGERKQGLRLILDLGLSISGHVVDEEGVPVKEASVSSADCYAITQADGSYTITGLVAGRHNVKVRHEEYVDASIDGVAVGSSDIDFSLTRRGAIEGHVLDAATGKPIERFQVTHFPVTYPPFHHEWRRGDVTQSDANGAFRIPNVPPGEVMVIARASGYPEIPVKVPQVLPAETTKGIVIRLKKGMSVEGKVVDPAGRPVANASVVAGAKRWDQQPQELGATQTDMEGKFTLSGLTEEVSAITAYHAAYPPTSVPVMLTEGQPNNVTVTFAKGGAVEGTVRIAGAPAQGYAVRVYVASGNMRGQLQATTTSSTGTFLVGNVPAGEASVSVTIAGIESGDSSKCHSLSKSAAVSEGIASVVDFDYVPGSASVTGTVTIGGQPVREGKVELVLTTIKGYEEHFRSLREEDNATYTFEDLPAASAKVFVAAYSPRGSKETEFSIQEGQAVSLDIDLSEEGADATGAAAN